MNILLVHSKPEIREIVAFPLEGKLSAVTHGVSNEAEALEVLKKVSPDVVVAENSSAATALLAKLTFTRPARLVLCDNTKGAAPAAIPGLTFLGFALHENLVENLLQLLTPAATADLAEGANPYCRINTALLLKTNPLAADIYIRLSPTKYVKLFQKNDEFDNNDLQRYREQKKIDYLYLLKDDCSLLMTSLLGELDKMLSANPPPSTQTATETVENVVETIHELIDKIGVTEEVQKAVQSSVKITMKAMGDFPQLSEIMKMVQDANGKYIGRHTMLLTHIACSMAVCMDWYSESTFEKLTMAAFFHDAPLKDHDLCAVKELSEFEKQHKGKFNLSQVQEYKAHPEKAVMLLGHFKEMPAEVDKIILQHHEHPMGSGFPGQLSSNYITPLSSLFIVSHDLTDYILDREGKFDIDEFLAAFEKKYSSGNFKKIAKQLSEVELF